MAEADWTPLVGNLSGGNITDITSTVIVPPTGGGSFTRIVKTQSNTTGVWAEHYSGLAAFTPTAEGAVWSTAIKKELSAGATGYAGFIFVCLADVNVSDNAYMFGFGNSDPCHLILRKGALSGGLPDVEPAAPLQPLNQGVIRRSVEAFSVGQWLHLQLMVATNTNGDSVLSVYRNIAAVNAAVWQAIPGMDPFVDDAAGVATGTPAYANGYVGRGGWFAATSRIIAFDFDTGRAQT